ncbi:hypothetical protein IF1G_04044 [Cordyceps javanica]|uniref:Uncharacterized protein n=1 Tax=Cordyceps javanica TaxID=43265 RepID=A0A545V511_9HYPO|nr:hypothetical protein IF1G_04044 [Cordyceps javanica]
MGSVSLNRLTEFSTGRRKGRLGASVRQPVSQATEGCQPQKSRYGAPSAFFV